MPGKIHTNVLTVISCALPMISLLLPACLGKTPLLELHDETPPVLLSSVPADGATNQYRNLQLQVALDDPILGSSISSNSLRLEAADGSLVPTDYAQSGKDPGAITLIPVSNLAANGSYTLVVDTALKNAVGLALPRTHRVRFSTGTNLDPGLPVISISTPSNLQWVGGLFSLSGSASVGGSPVSEVQLKAGNNLPEGWSQADLGEGNNWSTDLNSGMGNFREGTNIVYARARTVEGKIAETTVQIRVDNVPPSLTISAPAAGTTIKAMDANFSGTAGNDGAPLVSVAYQVDGTNGAWTTATGTDTWSFTLDTVPIEDGSHNVYVRAVDAAGNTGISGNSYIVDNWEEWAVATVDADAGHDMANGEHFAYINPEHHICYAHSAANFQLNTMFSESMPILAVRDNDAVITGYFSSYLKTWRGSTNGPFTYQSGWYLYTPQTYTGYNHWSGIMIHHGVVRVQLTNEQLNYCYDGNAVFGNNIVRAATTHADWADTQSVTYTTAGSDYRIEYWLYKHTVGPSSKIIEDDFTHGYNRDLSICVDGSDNPHMAYRYQTDVVYNTTNNNRQILVTDNSSGEFSLDYEDGAILLGYLNGNDLMFLIRKGGGTRSVRVATLSAGDRKQARIHVVVNGSQLDVYLSAVKSAILTRYKMEMPRP